MKPDDKLKFFHLRSKTSNRGTTIAYYIEVEAKRVYYRVARCNPKDNFCYRIGRDISSGRLKKHGPTGDFVFTNYVDIKRHFVTKYHPDGPAPIKPEEQVVIVEEPKGYQSSTAGRLPKPSVTASKAAAMYGEGSMWDF